MGGGGGPQGVSQTYLVYRPFLVQKMKLKHKKEEEEEGNSRTLSLIL